MVDTRVSESDLVMPTLRFLAESTEGFMKTSDLIENLQALFQPTGKDDELIKGRNDTHFSQKVRNMISHRTSENSFIRNGYAEYDADRKGLMITEKGRELLTYVNG